MSTRTLTLLTALTSACWIGPSDWDAWELENGVIDTDTPEGDADTDADADTDTDADGDADADSDSDTDTDIDPLDSDDDDDGYTENEGDCDDTDQAVNPGATEDYYDGVDNDCDGWVDGELALNDADAKFIGEDAGDYAGQCLQGPGDLSGDGRGDLVIGAWGNSALEHQSGRVYLLTRPVSGSVDLADADIILDGGSYNADAGWSLAGNGDLDGDTRLDLAASAVNEDGGDGSVYVLEGPITTSGSLPDLADGRLMGSSEQLGAKLASGGDLNGDGKDDLVVGNNTYCTAYVVYGPVSAETGVSAAASGTISGSMQTTSMRLASDGDITGDGLDDVLAGNYYDDRAATDAGAVLVIAGPATGTLSWSSDAHAVIQGAYEDNMIGMRVEYAGDMDQDGHDDILVGAQLDDSAADGAGAAYLVRGPLTGRSSINSAHAKVTGEAAGDYASSGISTGDFDGDGWLDFLIGAHSEETGGENAGAAYLVLGPVSGVFDLASADRFLFGSGGEYAGAEVDMASDFDGDGRDEALIGAYYDSSGGSQSGAAYLLLGHAF